MIGREDEISFQISEVVRTLQNSTPIQNYMEMRKRMNQNEEAQARKKKFQEAKKAFAEVEPYGKWAPDYEEKRTELSQAKKQLDENDAVQDFKDAERNLERLLDDLTDRIFSHVLASVPIAFQSRFPSIHKGNSCACKSGKFGCKCKE